MPTYTFTLPVAARASVITLTNEVTGATVDTIGIGASTGTVSTVAPSGAEVVISSSLDVGEYRADASTGQTWRLTEYSAEGVLDVPASLQALPDTIDTAIAPGEHLARLRDVALVARARNPIDLPVMAAPPTITTGTTNPDAALNSMFTFWTSTGAFRMIGATPVVYATNYARGAAVTLPTGTGNVTATQNGNRHAIEFYTDATKFSAHFTGSATEGVHFQVDDEFATAAPTAYAGTSGNAYFTVEFATRKPRRIRMWGEQAMSFYRVFTHPSTKIWTNPGDEPVTVAFLGDSIAAAGAAANAAQQVGQLLGWQDVRQIALGGTGYVNAGTYTSTFGNATRVADIAAVAPEVIVAMTTPNDAGQATLQAAALAAFQAWRVAAPTATIIITGMFPGSNSAGVNHIAAEAAVLAAFTAWADDNSYWIPIISDPAGSWVTGTGRVGATTGVGNADIYVQDGVHPSVAGYGYFAQRLAATIRRRVLGIT